MAVSVKEADRFLTERVNRKEMLALLVLPTGKWDFHLLTEKNVGGAVLVGRM